MCFEPCACERDVALCLGGGDSKCEANVLGSDCAEDAHFKRLCLPRRTFCQARQQLIERNDGTCVCRCALKFGRKLLEPHIAAASI